LCQADPDSKVSPDKILVKNYLTQTGTAWAWRRCSSGSNELGGETYEYAGDAVIASWYLGKGNQEQQAIEAAFAACDAVHRRSEWFRQNSVKFLGCLSCIEGR